MKYFQLSSEIAPFVLSEQCTAPIIAVAEDDFNKRDQYHCTFFAGQEMNRSDVFHLTTYKGTRGGYFKTVTIVCETRGEGFHILEGDSYSDQNPCRLAAYKINDTDEFVIEDISSGNYFRRILKRFSVNREVILALKREKINHQLKEGEFNSYKFKISCV